MEVLKTTAIGRNLGEAYNSLLEEQDCFSEDVNRFEVLAARRISTQFQVADELAKESFGGKKTVEVWEFEVFGHLDLPETPLKAT